EPYWRVGIDGQLERVREAPLCPESRRERIDDQRHGEDDQKREDVTDNRTQQPGQDRRVTADKGRTDQACYRWAQCERRDIAREQALDVSRLARDDLPLGPRRQHDRFRSRLQRFHGCPRAIPPILRNRKVRSMAAQVLREPPPLPRAALPPGVGLLL